MELAIIGLPSSGRSTLFSLLTQGRGEATTLPWRVGVARIPDPRLQKLEQMFQPKKTIPAEVRYIDVTLPPQEWRGALLNQLSQSDAFVLTVRAFREERVAHPLGTIDPHRDLARAEGELLFSDLAAVETRLQRIAERLPKTKAVEREPMVREQSLLSRLKAGLEQEIPLRAQELKEEELRLLEGFALVTIRPMLVVLNLGEEDLPQAEALEREWRQRYRRPHFDVLAISAKLELELSQLAPAEAAEFRSALKAGEGAVERLLQLSYRLLGLITFFTVVSGEAKAWSVPRQIAAVKAAGKIHSDMEKGFIRAEVVAWEDLMRSGSMANARRQGLLRLEGKNYPVQDGDVITFLFNV